MKLSWSGKTWLLWREHAWRSLDTSKSNAARPNHIWRCFVQISKWFGNLFDAQPDKAQSMTRTYFVLVNICTCNIIQYYIRNYQLLKKTMSVSVQPSSSRANQQTTKALKQQHSPSNSTVSWWSGAPTQPLSPTLRKTTGACFPDWWPSKHALNPPVSCPSPARLPSLLPKRLWPPPAISGPAWPGKS